MNRRSAPTLSQTGLQALLGLIDRPVALVAADGASLAGNAAFAEFCARHGGDASELRSLLLPDSFARLMLRLEREETGAPAAVEFVLRDGENARAEVELHATGSGARVLVVAFDAPAGGGPGAAAASALRHDIAGPLTAILGTAELALLRGGERLSQDVRDSLQQVIENCGRMSEILQRSRASERGGGESGG